MNFPKGKILTLVVIFAAIGLVTATGAFTTVSAERTATVNVAGDSSALLGIAPYDGPNGNPLAGGQDDDEGYAKIASDGTVEINLAGYNTGASGVNENAETVVENVLVITNNGAQEVNVSITDADTDDGSESDLDDNQYVTFYNGTHTGTMAGAPGTSSGSLEGGQATLAPGESVVVSIRIDTRGATHDGDLVDGITIEANAT